MRAITLAELGTFTLEDLLDLDAVLFGRLFLTEKGLKFVTCVSEFDTQKLRLREILRQTVIFCCRAKPGPTERN